MEKKTWPAKSPSWKQSRPWEWSFSSPRSFSSRPGSACLLFTSPYFPARTKRRLKRPLWRREGLALFASRSETWKSETDRNFIRAPESLVPQSLSPHSGQTHYACAVPAEVEPEVTMDFAYDRCELFPFMAVKRKIQRHFRFSPPRTLYKLEEKVCKTFAGKRCKSSTVKEKF